MKKKKQYNKEENCLFFIKSHNMMYKSYFKWTLNFSNVQIVMNFI